MCLGLPGRVLRITDAATKRGLVDLDGEHREVNLACLASGPEELEALCGAWVMVHLGFAMQRVDAAEAEASRALLAEIHAAMREASGGG